LIQNLIMAAEHININSWQHRRVVFATGAMLLLILLIRTGWAAEDAYISLLLTVGAYFLLMYQQTGSAMVVGTAILLSSKAFMDFSVSGLENPATHFGIAAFCWAYWRKQSALVLTLIASLTAVNRLDSFLLFVPALLLVYYRLGWQAWKPVMLGLTPLIAWEMFSLFYYGFPFPNTAYAKLNTGVSSGELIRQGVAYLSNDYHWDKVTAIVIVAGILSGLWNTDWPLALGVLASVLYVVRVGGDFMSGRFLSPALFLACGLIVRRTRLRWPATLGIATAILLLGLRNPRPTLTTTSNFGVGLPTPMSHGIADERAIAELS
jgi:arabinofuranosyltransferase